MVKKCNKCDTEYRGFGNTCSNCRKSVTSTSSTPVLSAPSADACYICHKKVFFMEKLCVEGLVLHSTCFRCSVCNNKLPSGKFARDTATGKFLCMTHYKEAFRLRGKYDFSASKCPESTSSPRSLSEASPGPECLPETSPNGETEMVYSYDKLAKAETIATWVGGLNFSRRRSKERIRRAQRIDRYSAICVEWNVCVFYSSGLSLCDL